MTKTLGTTIRPDEVNCDVCQDTGTHLVKVYKHRHDGTVDKRLEEVSCQECCEHGDYDHGICGICSKDCHDDLIGAAEAYYEGER